MNHALLARKKEYTMTKTAKRRKISQTMIKWLLVCVVIAFTITTVLTYVLQTELLKRSTEDLLRLNIEDVRQDVIDASDENLLFIANTVATLINTAPVVDQSYLDSLARMYDVAEISIISQDGIITVSTNDNFFGFAMDSGDQSTARLPISKQGPALCWRAWRGCATAVRKCSSHRETRSSCIQTA